MTTCAVDKLIVLYWSSSSKVGKVQGQEEEEVVLHLTHIQLHLQLAQSSRTWLYVTLRCSIQLVLFAKPYQVEWFIFASESC